MAHKDLGFALWCDWIPEWS